MEPLLEALHTRDAIYETIVLRTSRGRAWSAISEANEFGTWFGARFDRHFEPGQRIRGTTHTGVPIELTPWRERHPLLAAPGVAWRYWRARRRA